MKLHHLATALFLVLGLVVMAWAADKKDLDKEKLLGKWECTEGPEHAKGATVEFLKDGKGKVTLKGSDKPEEFKYEIDGDSVKVTHKNQEGKEVMQAHKIKSLTDKEMVAENEKGEVSKFKKKLN